MLYRGAPFGCYDARLSVQYHTGDSDAEDSENFESSASNMAAPDKRVFRRSWFCMLRVVYQRDFRHIPRSADIKKYVQFAKAEIIMQ